MLPSLPRHNSYKILIIGYIWPELTSSAAGLRDWNLVNSFLKAGWQITFASAAQQNSFSQQLAACGVSVVSIQPNHSDFDVFIRSLQPDFVIYDRFVTEEQYGWRIYENCPNAICVLDTQDLHFLRKARQNALINGKSLQEIAECQFDLETDTALREIASIYRCDATLVLSDFEKTLLISKFNIPKELIHLSRFHYPSLQPSPEFQERQHFIMLGNFRHPPNADGILWLKSKIWPLILKKLPTARVNIYGAYPPKEMMNLTDPSIGFYVHGPVLDQFHVLKKSRVNLAPLRFGAGIKGKITDGWWSGTPVITTPMGAEGMYESFVWGGFICNDEEEFSNQAVILHENQTLWKVAQQHGFDLIRKLYQQDTNSTQLIQYFIELKLRIDSQRKKNFIGLMLKHHNHRSTKYFSKWIEEKNKIRQEI